MSPQLSYSEDPAWADIVPLPQDDGGPNPLAAIAYTEEYSEAMAYLRAVMAKNEYSDRILDLTEDIISMNPAHYTVWLYRARCIFELKKDLRDEMNWLNRVSLKHLKNYQIWHHRQLILDKLDDPSGEADFIAQMFARDAKNYHVWSYRQWLVKRFSLWNDREMADVEDLIRRDVRNNSAWNHRWFLVFGREQYDEKPDQSIIEKEILYAKAAIALAPQNPSPWSYLRGILKHTKRPLSGVVPFALEFASLDKPDDVRSSYALDLLADAWAVQEDKKKDAEKALDLLATKYDPIRKGYWEYRKKLLVQPPLQGQVGA